MNINRKVYKILKKANKQGFLDGFDFSIIIQNLIISKDGYIIATGNYENVNAEVAIRLVNNIKRHPLLWKIFMVG